MDVRVLGPVELDGTAVTGREASVLAALALAAPRAMSVDALVDAVWGDDPPPSAGKSLQNAVSRLRRIGGTDLIETVERGYRLHADVDTQRAETLADEHRYEEALALWRGEPVAVPPAEQVRLAELHASLEDDIAGALLTRGDAAAAIALLERGVAVEPYREHRWALLTHALAAAGRHGEALRAAHRARELLREELGLEPGPELVAAERAALEPGPASTRRIAPVPTTSFVGRDDDVRRLTKCLADETLVTLTGPGGVGKTRLALVAIQDRAVTYVDLAPVSTPDRVWEAVAAAAGIATTPGVDVIDSVIAALADGLLVLDNCEHVLDVAAQVAIRVNVRVLATSREPLGLQGECVVAVAPLHVVDGVQLFLDRAAAAGGDVDDLDAVERVCQRLDGLPLAIELAAARVPVLSAEQLVARLDDRFRLLDDRARRGDPRHRALRTLVDWSYELLADEERLLFDRLSVFRAPFTLEDVEAVVTDDQLPLGAVAPAVTRLVRASLVAVETHEGIRRFRLLETFRAYAEAHLVDVDVWRRRHLEWIATFVDTAAPELSGPDQVWWFARVGARLDDVQESLAWCERHGPASTGLGIASGLFHFWMGRARRAEGLRWLERFSVTATDVPSVERCRGLFGAAALAMMSDMSTCRALGDLAQRIADDRDARAVADTITALVPLFAGDADTAMALMTPARLVLEEPQHDGTFPQIWDFAGFVPMLRGDYTEARRQWRRNVDRIAAMGDRHLYGGCLSFEADMAFAAGAVDEATALASEALVIAREVLCPSCESAALGAVAITTDAETEGGAAAALQRAVALAAGIGEVSGVEYAVHALVGALADIDAENAARMLGALDALRHATGRLLELPGRRAFTEPRVARARQRLGSDAWDVLVTEGRALTYDELVTLAS